VDFIPPAIRALPEALRQRVHLVFLGAGEKAETLKTDCAENPSIRCHFTGFVNQSGLSAWYHAADVLLLPSLEMETWGLVVNDALHHGLPAVVTSAVGCAPDLVLPGITGEVCQPGSADSLADALTCCAEWSLPSSEKLRQNCRDRVNQYTISDAAVGLKQAWHKVQSTF
jgi:glycosyltransferase involved in cell wall biosynthesis